MKWTSQRCVLPFRWIYYYDSNKSTGKETGKTLLCACTCLELFNIGYKNCISTSSCNFSHFLVPFLNFCILPDRCHQYDHRYFSVDLTICHFPRFSEQEIVLPPPHLYCLLRWLNFRRCFQFVLIFKRPSLSLKTVA